MMDIFFGLLIAFSMYSKIPVPQVEWTKERMKYMLCYFPLIGAVIGAVMLLWMHFGTCVVGDGNLYRAILVLIPIIITGGIHMDGFLDTSDALSSYKPMEEKLKILKDSHAGAFAILMCSCYFLLAFGTYSEITWPMMRVMAVGFVLSRSLSGLSVVLFKKAKNSGLANLFSGFSHKAIVAGVLTVLATICVVAMIALDPFFGIVAVVAAGASFLFYKELSYRKFGGTTGDLAGFFLQICELVMAFAMVVASNMMHIAT